jgi:hypothetical protein
MLQPVQNVPQPQHNKQLRPLYLMWRQSALYFDGHAVRRTEQSVVLHREELVVGRGKYGRGVQLTQVLVDQGL